MSLKLIKSKHIYLDSTHPPISGYVLIQNSKILNIISFNDLKPSEESELLAQAELFDFTESFVMPGIIDLNVHTNCSFEDWQDVENTTRQAIQGGVTTIFDNPIMGKYDEKFDDARSLAARKSALEGHIYTDCGLLGYLGPHNYKRIEQLWKERELLGFKAYLSNPIQSNLPFFKKKEALLKLAALIKRLDISDLFLSIHPEKATLTDLYLSSPLRSFEVAKRMDLKEDITNSQKFGGGIHGEMSSSDDSNKSDISEEEPEPAETNMRDQLRAMIPVSAILRKKAQENDRLREEQNIHKQEIREYFFNEEEKEIIKNLQSSDSEIEYQNETTSSSSEEEERKNMSIKENDSIPQTRLIPQAQGLRLRAGPLMSMARPLNEERPQVFQDNPLKNMIRGAIDILRAHTEPPLTTLETPEKEAERRRKGSGLLQRRKVANSAIVGGGSKEPEDLKNFQISIKKGQSTMNKIANQANKIYENFLFNHSLSWETNGAKSVLKAFVNFNKGNIVLSNLSSLSLAFLIREGLKKNPDLRIFCETSTPFLYFSNCMVKKGQCKFKSSPPIRDQETRNLLLEGVKIPGLFQAVSSFHMSVPRKLKKINGGDFKRCFNGLSSIGMNLQVLWSKMYSKEKIALNKYGDKLIYEQNLDDIFRILTGLLCERPAKMAFLRSKGRLAKGLDADIVVWNPFEVKEVRDKDIYLKEKKGFLFRKQRLYGVVKATFLRGEEVFNESERKFVKRGAILRREGESSV